MEIIIGIIFVVLVGAVFFSRKPKAVVVEEAAPVAEYKVETPVAEPAPVVEEAPAKKPRAPRKPKAETAKKPAKKPAAKKPAAKKTAKTRAK